MVKTENLKVKDKFKESLSDHFSYYDDIGKCYEFSFLSDDAWKKDDIFTRFAVKLLREIALDEGIPVEAISWGKWGGRIIVEPYDDNTVLEWAERIENHPAFIRFRGVCSIATERNEATERQENLIMEYEVLVYGFINNCSDQAKWLEGAKRKLGDDYPKLIKMLKNDGYLEE